MDTNERERLAKVERTLSAGFDIRSEERGPMVALDYAFHWYALSEVRAILDEQKPTTPAPRHRFLRALLDYWLAVPNARR